MAEAVKNIDRISEAMRTLDELAFQEKEEIKDLLSTQYRNLRRTLFEIEPEVRSTLKHASERMSQFASSSSRAAQEKMKNISHDVERSVHKNPWTALGISAIAGVLAGYFIGYRFNKSEQVEPKA